LTALSQLANIARLPTTHVLFEPQDFIARLAALVPRPRSHLLRYHGLLAPNARHRRLVVPRRPVQARPPGSDETPSQPTAPMSWMARLQRVFELDISACPKCGGEVRVIATVTEPAVIARILKHLHYREHDAPEPRGPPQFVA